LEDRSVVRSKDPAGERKKKYSFGGGVGGGDTISRKTRGESTNRPGCKKGVGKNAIFREAFFQTGQRRQSE